jgi:L-ascorbate metabolism protein UlaG (beta-lactamase superfamily)
MPTEVTWLGHGSFQIKTKELTLQIDPFLTDQPTAPCKADDLEADFILISHGHADHVGDSVAIAQRTGATVIANYEITAYFQKQGIERVHPQHIGGAHEHPFGKLKLTIAHHGSALPDGSNGGNPCGFLLYLEDGKLYHAADTGLFYDMKLIGEEGIDLALLPIGDNFTMGPEDALRAVKLIEPRKVVPMHYNTWPLIEQNPQKFADNVRGETNAWPVVLKPGQSCGF